MAPERRAVTAHEAEHGEEEHAEGHEALLAVLELKGTDTEAFDDAVEELAKVVNHHLTEEELTPQPGPRRGRDRLRPSWARRSPPSGTRRSTTAAGP